MAVAVLELMSDQSRWVHRRTEVVDLLRREVVRRTVRVEFTLPSHVETELELPGGGYAVPLAFLRKERARNFSVEEGGSPIGTLTRVENAAVASHVLAFSADLARSTRSPASLRALFDALVESAPEQADDALDDVMASMQFGGSDVRSANDARFEYFVLTLAHSYLLMAPVSSFSGRHVVDFAYDDRVRFAFSGLSRPRRIAAAMGWQPLLVDVDLPGALEAPSFHAEVVVPEELRVSAFIYDSATGDLLSSTVERSVDRASLHVPDTSKAADPVAVVAVRAERAGAPTQAALVASVTAVLLCVGGWFASIPKTGTTGTSTTLLLAGSAIFASAVVRAEEHRLVRQVLFGPRALLVVTALLALTAAAAVGFGASTPLRESVWRGTGACAVIAASMLWVSFFVAAPRSVDVDPTEGSV